MTTDEDTLRVRCCGIVCLRTLTDDVITWIRHLASRRAGCPIILVVPLSADSARLVAEDPAGSRYLIWLEEVPEQLADRVAAVAGLDPVAGILRCVARGLGEEPFVLNALKKMASTHPPIAAVLELSTRLGVTPNTLRYHWARTTGGDPTLKEFLEWVLLLRAADLAHLAPVSAAYRLDIHVRTLERMSDRRLGVTLAGMRRHGIDFVAGRFRERLGGLLA